ncbi:hypothetical protein SKAU_G00260520 [Synaphobranchus kaupii]|uniref:Uncharacterized protein n=1 Tax=Synaphobranchus kaupii TaxID=118154 RepID=A0A9Q1F4K9_SYNKA|nr:hypothetical protein SKAU_G00260520 [Synaphobranchus kaupii]
MPNGRGKQTDLDVVRRHRDTGSTVTVTTRSPRVETYPPTPGFRAAASVLRPAAHFTRDAHPPAAAVNGGVSPGFPRLLYDTF